MSGLAALVLVLVAAPTPEETAVAARKVLTGGHYQSELPGVVPALSPGPTGKGPHKPWVERPSEATAMESIADVLWWSLVGVAAVLLLAWLVREFTRPRSDQVEPEVVPGKAAAAPVELPDPDGLAAAGDYSGAIHALLLRLFARMQRSAAAPSWTSREIAHRVQLGTEPRKALFGLVLAVEVSRFGSAQPDASVYSRCREYYETCTAALSGTAS